MRSLTITDLNFLEVAEFSAKSDVKGGVVNVASGLNIVGPGQVKIEGDVLSSTQVTAYSSETGSSGGTGSTDEPIFPPLILPLFELDLL